MTDRLEDVWTTRDYPVLREVTRRADAGENTPTIQDVAESVQLPADQVALAARALLRRGLIVEVHEDGGGVWGFGDVAGAAYLMTGLHPDTDDALSALVQLLRDTADQEPDEDERGRLRRAADALGGVSRGVMTGVMTAYLTGQLPGH